MSEVYPLSTLTSKIGSGATPSGGKDVYLDNGDIALIRSQNVLDFSFSYNGLAYLDNTQASKLNNVTVNRNDVLLNITGDSIARTCVVPEQVLPARVNQHVSIIRAKDTDSAFYIHYYLQYLKPYLLKICGVGGTRNALTKVEIGKLLIRFPENRKEIAAVLSALDAKIDLNNRINAELEAIAKTLYDYWFVQFDFPDANGKPYKSSGGKMVWNEVLKRDVPRGWSDAIIGNVLAKPPASNKMASTTYALEGAIPVIDQSTDFICGYTNDISAKITPTDAHIVFGDHTRIVKLINFDYARGADGTQVLLSRIEELPNYLLYQMIAMTDLTNYGYARHFKFLKDSKIIIPNVATANLYQSTVIPWFSKIRESIFENIELEKLRDWLLPMLMNGQVRVR